MGIKKSLRNLVIQNGGTGDSESISGLVDELLVAENPLWKLTLDVGVSDSTDLFGKNVSDLQKDVYIDHHDVINGTLFYVDDYTGFSSDTDQQKGNYLVVHAEVPEETDVTITVSKDGGTTQKALDEDGILVFRVTDPATQKLTFIASKQGSTSATRVYSLKGLTCKKA